MMLNVVFVIALQTTNDTPLLSPYWSTVDRLGMQFVFVVALIYVIYRIAKNSAVNLRILEMAQEDREAREQALNDLKKSAETLAARTDAALLVTIHDDVKETKELTRAAADESRNAAHIANASNEKIRDLNQRLVDATTTAMRKDHAEIHRHIDNAVEAVDQKVADIVSDEGKKK